MRSPYHPAEIRSAMTLKSLTIKAVAEQLSVSRRTLDYFINEGRHLVKRRWIRLSKRLEEL
jgi:plasmid maintenance system antidote protein VapI